MTKLSANNTSEEGFVAHLNRLFAPAMAPALVPVA